MITATPQQLVAEPGASRPPAAVELRGAAISFGRRPVLSGVDLTVGQGHFIAVLGPNGAGKSTLMKAILGLVPLSAGTVTLLGGRPSETRGQVGYMPQRRNFGPEARIRGVDLVRLGLDGNRWGVPAPLTSAARRRHRVERELVSEAIELVGAGAYCTRPIGSLSGGEQQRLLIAQSLVRHPSLLILDEPLDSLDLPSQANVAALARNVCAAAGVSVLLVAHDVNPLLGYLDGVVYLAGGHATAGSVDEVITTESLTALYGVPIEVLRTADGRLVVVGQPEAPHVHGHRHDEP